VLSLAGDWEGMPVLARAFELCRTRLGVEVEGPIATAAARYEPTRRERRAIASYVGSRRSFATKVLASLPYVEGTSAKLALVRAATFPDRALRRTVGPEGTLHWLQKGVRGLRRRDVDEPR
jgi:hypothetical protein